MTHTPGPWKVKKSWITTLDEVEIVAAMPNSLASPFDADPHRQANARLIAAAPEMLGALRAIADMSMEDSTDHAQLAALCIAVARTAIAKTTEAQ